MPFIDEEPSERLWNLSKDLKASSDGLEFNAGLPPRFMLSMYFLSKSDLHDPSRLFLPLSGFGLGSKCFEVSPNNLKTE